MRALTIYSISDSIIKLCKPPSSTIVTCFNRKSAGDLSEWSTKAWINSLKNLSPSKQYSFHKKEEKESLMPALKYEYEIMTKMDKFNGFPKVYHFGEWGIFNVLVMELLDKNMEQLLNECNRSLSLKSVLMIID